MMHVKDVCDVEYRHFWEIFDYIETLKICKQHMVFLKSIGRSFSIALMNNSSHFPLQYLLI